MIPWMIAAIANAALVVALLAVLWMQGRMHARERAGWKDLIETMDRAWEKAYEFLGNMQQLGTPTPKAAVVAEEVTAEDRVNRAISAATIAKGIERLRQEYVSAGLGVPTDEELHSQVLSMLGGNEPTVERILPRD